MQLNHCIMYSLFTHKRICQHCGTEFVSQKSTTKYCSKRCANIAGKARTREYLLQLKQRTVTETRRQELMENPYLSLTQAAKLLQISRTTLYQLIKKHNIPKKKTNNIVYISKKHWEEARGNTFNKEGYYTIFLVVRQSGLADVAVRGSAR